MGTEVLTQVNVLIMTLIAIGVAVAAYGEVNFVVIGVIEQLSALVFEATRLVLVQARMRLSPHPNTLSSTRGCLSSSLASAESPTSPLTLPSPAPSSTPLGRCS